MGKTNVISPRTGTAFLLEKGMYLKVICPKGEQVADLVAYNSLEKDEILSNGKTFDYEQTIRLTTGNSLWSNMSRPMLAIIHDTCGIHDFLLSPCCPMTMKIFYGVKKEVPSCRENLYGALQAYGVERSSIPTAFNVFMNVPLDSNYHLSVEAPVAKEGDYILFKAQMDLLIGLTACSALDSNNQSFKPIEYSIGDDLY